MRGKNDGTTLNGFIDRGSHFSGELTFEETFRIDGRFEGKILSGSELILGDSAEVSAEIEVGRLSVNGNVARFCSGLRADRASGSQPGLCGSFGSCPQGRGRSLPSGVVQDEGGGPLVEFDRAAGIPA